MADTKPDNKSDVKPAAKTAYVAEYPLTVANGAIAYPAGAEVPAHVLDSDIAKANDWADKVTKN